MTKPHLAKLITPLTFVSGMCGIAYELLYARLLTTYLGDMFHVNAAILVAFLLGIGIGSLLAHRWVRHLWVIELFIGVYAALCAGALGVFSDSILERVLPWATGSWLVTIGLLIAVLAAPATLVGFSVPLFACYLDQNGRDEKHGSFQVVYWAYNLGASVCVLAIEFALLRTAGVRNSLLLLAALNVANAVVLRFWVPPPPDSIARQPSAAPRFALAALFLAAVASGVFQLVFLKWTESIFGPFHENFAVAVALGLLGIALGSGLLRDRRPGLGPLLVVGGGLIALNLALMGPLIHLWTLLNGLFGVVGALSTGAKLLVLALLGLVPFTVLGATVPSLVADRSSDRRLAGLALGVASLGNCAGYLLTTLFVYERLSFRVIATIIPGLLVLLGAVLLFRGREVLRFHTWAALVLAVGSLAIVFAAWPERLLHIGYVYLLDARVLDTAQRSMLGIESAKRLDSEVSLLTSRSGEELMVINGYTSVAATSGGRTNTRELLFGLVPAVYSARHDQALVLGVGTGITAGSTASVYGHTDAVEVNPAVMALLPRFAAHNFDLTRNPAVNVVLDDGLSFLARAERRYDAIVNTVTSPLYFSSSKLYTRDFFRLVRARLAKGGVYALWFDGRVTASGARVVFQTLSESFPECHFVYLDSGYTQAICGEGPLLARSFPWPSALEAKFGLDGSGLDLNAVIDAVAFPRHRLHQGSWGGQGNSFDLPRLEFVMASDALAVSGKKREFSPYEILGVDLNWSAFSPKTPLDGEAVARRCYALRVWADRPTDLCAAVVAQAGTATLNSYVEPLLAHLEKTKRASRERLGLLRRLLHSGRGERVLSALESLKPQMGNTPEFFLVQAETLLEQNLDPPDELLAELFRLAPLDPDVRRVVARAAAGRGLAAEALVHLRLLRAVGGMRPEDAQLEATLLSTFPSAVGAPP